MFAHFFESCKLCLVACPACSSVHPTVLFHCHGFLMSHRPSRASHAIDCAFIAMISLTSLDSFITRRSEIFDYSCLVWVALSLDVLLFCNRCLARIFFVRFIRQDIFFFQQSKVSYYCFIVESRGRQCTFISVGGLICHHTEIPLSYGIQRQ